LVKLLIRKRRKRKQQSRRERILGKKEGSSERAQEGKRIRASKRRALKSLKPKELGNKPIQEGERSRKGKVLKGNCILPLQQRRNIKKKKQFRARRKCESEWETVAPIGTKEKKPRGGKESFKGSGDSLTSSGGDNTKGGGPISRPIKRTWERGRKYQGLALGEGKVAFIGSPTNRKGGQGNPPVWKSWANI